MEAHEEPVLILTLLPEGLLVVSKKSEACGLYMALNRLMKGSVN